MREMADRQVLRRAYRYRIYPTRRQAEALEAQLGFACALYNAALEQRRDWWKRGRRTGAYDQGRELTVLRRAGLAPEGMNAACQENVLQRLDHAFVAFFRRVRAGKKPGYPRFKSRLRYDSLTWRKRDGAAIVDGRLRLQGIGHVKVEWHRALPDAAPDTTTVRRAAGKWYVSFVVEVDPVPLPSTGEEVGVDLGILTFAALSNGEMALGPRAFRAAQRELRVAQRRLARRRRGSHRRDDARRLVAKQYERIREVRRDHAHKLARDLVERFDRIYVEDLNIAGLGRTWLAKDVNDQGWGMFLTILRAKAEEAGRVVIAVDARGTSQLCSACGAVVAKPLSEREHRCGCGYTADRDVNAARNVLRAGQALQALTGTVPVV